MNKRSIVAGAAGLPLAIIFGISVSTAHADVNTGMPIDTNSVVSGTVALDLLKDQASSFEAPLPQGVKWNNSLGIEEPTDGVSVRVEPSFVQSTMATYWLCAWEDSLVSTSKMGDVVGAERALSMVNSFTSLDVYQKNFIDPNAGWRRTVADPALHGDLAGVKAELASGCTLYFEEQPAP